MRPRRLSTKRREELYLAEAAKAEAAGQGSLPICVICGLPVDGRRDRWDQAHDPERPRFLGGDIVGVAHERCNRQHNNKHDTPLFHRINRIRQRFIGAFRPRTPFPGSRDHYLRKRMDGTVERRD